MTDTAAVKIVLDVIASRAQSLIREALKMRLKSSGVLKIANWAPVLFGGRAAMVSKIRSTVNTIQQAYTLRGEPKQVKLF